MQFAAGKRHAVKLEYFYNGGQGATKLHWTPPGGQRVPVPANAFRLPDRDAWGLRGEYFKDKDLKTPWATRDDGTVNFAWGVKPPLSGAAESGETALQIELHAGQWTAEWIDTKTGATAKRQTEAGEGVRTFSAPAYEQDIALRLRKR